MKLDYHGDSGIGEPAWKCAHTNSNPCPRPFAFPMGLRLAHGDESALLRLIDSKWAMGDFRQSAIADFATIDLGFIFCS